MTCAPFEVSLLKVEHQRSLKKPIFFGNNTHSGGTLGVFFFSSIYFPFPLRNAPFNESLRTMANTGSTSKKRQEFLDVIFSWSLSDVLNKHLYKFQLEEVPLTFSSTTHYMNSFIYLLLEETRADMFSQLAGISQAPASPLFGLWKMPTDSRKKMFCRMTLTGLKYDPMVGDLIALTQVKPKRIDDQTALSF
ncbi:hypothetical protein HanOQP8_Chr02g0048461 [Helianthus annuus]|nr:hypothetical protein HanOQP8_Chr02g0048461 [Helianthus annuus]